MCPYCHREADRYFIREDEIIGCEYCIETAWSDEVFPESDGYENDMCDEYHARKDDGYYEDI